MLVGQTNNRGCSIVPRPPRAAKALAPSLLTFWIIVMAAAASPAIADEAPNRVRIEYALPQTANYQKSVPSRCYATMGSVGGLRVTSEWAPVPPPPWR